MNNIGDHRCGLLSTAVAVAIFWGVMWDPDRAKPGPIGLRDFKMDMQSLASCVNYTWPVISGSVLLGLRWEGNAHVCVCVLWDEAHQIVCKGVHHVNGVHQIIRCWLN